jgi:hypothetical protein
MLAAIAVAHATRRVRRLAQSAGPHAPTVRQSSR